MARSSHFLSTTILLICLAPVALSVKAKADRLVTVEGQVVETQGPWKVKGKLVIYTTPTGVLSSIRLSKVDLEASNEATRRAAEPRPKTSSAPQPQKPLAPVLVLTNKDLESPRTPPPVGRPTPVRGPAGRNAQSSRARAVRGPQAASTQVPTEMEESLGEAMEEMGQALDEMGEALAEGMNKGMEAMGEFFAIATELAVQAEALEKKYDMETAAGMRAAADDIAGLARQVRSRTEGVSPETRVMLEELAGELDELARLAREDPEAAIRKSKEALK